MKRRRDPEDDPGDVPLPDRGADFDADREVAARLLGGLLAAAWRRRQAGNREAAAASLGASPPDRLC